MASKSMVAVVAGSIGAVVGGFAGLLGDIKTIRETLWPEYKPPEIAIRDPEVGIVSGLLNPADPSSARISAIINLVIQRTGDREALNCFGELVGTKEQSIFGGIAPQPPNGWAWTPFMIDRNARSFSTQLIFVLADGAGFQPIRAPESFAPSLRLICDGVVSNLLPLPGSKNEGYWTAIQSTYAHDPVMGYLRLPPANPAAGQVPAVPAPATPFLNAQ